jgi:hypothetical protein
MKGFTMKTTKGLVMILVALQLGAAAKAEVSASPDLLFSRLTLNFGFRPPPGSICKMVDPGW